MPLYQYGMAFLYRIFGHFFYVQQIVSILLALLAVAWIALTAWNIFRDLRAVFLAGAVAGLTPQLHNFLYITQIENWYIPLICLTIYLWSAYWREPRPFRLFLLGLSLGLAYNCRTQGLFYFGLLCLSPLFLKSLSWKKRWAHVLGIVLIFGGTLIPWTVRNAIYQNSLSFSSGQAGLALMLNDHRLPLYAQQPYLADSFNWNTLMKEYQDKYPDPSARSRAVRRDFLRNTFGDPVWLIKAVYWRTLGFYGLLPPGVYDPRGPSPTDWKTQWQGYVYYGFYAIFFILVGVIGLLMRPQRSTLFLFLAVLANVALVIIAPMREPRYGFPVLPLHLLLGVCIFFSPAGFPGEIRPGSQKPRDPRRFPARGLSIGFFTVLFLGLCFFSSGRANLYRPLMEKARIVMKDIRIDPQAPSLNGYYRWSLNKDGSEPLFTEGARVRLTCRVTNYMLPPKCAGRVAYLPDFASDPARETFYYAYPRLIPSSEESGIAGVSFFGAFCNQEIREDDTVELEGVILSNRKNDTLAGLDYWVRAEKVVLVQSPGRN